MLYHPSKMLWVNPNIEYLFNREIIEYDMKDAGINIIEHFNLLDRDQIKVLKSLDKKDRYIAIGKLRGKDKIFSQAMSERFTEVREIFINSNKLSDSNIISVKNDAIYTIDSCRKTKFGQIEFIPKNSYSSYIRFINNMGIEVYYNENDIDIKGMSDSAINKHRLYMVMFLKKSIYYIESNHSILKKHLRSFVNEYKANSLDDGYYLEFNNLSNIYNPIYNYQKVIVPLIQISLKEMNMT